MNTPHRRRRRATVILAALILAVTTACGADDTQNAHERTVDNCGNVLGFTEVPDRVVLLKSASVPTLHSLGVLGNVIAKAGTYPAAYYDDATRAELDRIPELTDRVDASGHLQISREEIVAQDPDLVIGHTNTVNQQTLKSSGIPSVEEPAFCGSLEGDANWDDVYDQVRMYGTIFDRSGTADDVVTQLREQVGRVESQSSAGRGRTAAVLYPTVGGGVTYAYGRGSMSAPVLASAGLTNVFGDVADRVFEVNAEDIIGRNPDVLILLYSAGDPDQVTAAATSLPGMGSVTAVRDNAMLPLLLNYAEPPTPLAVEGAQKIIEYLRGRP